MNRCYKLIILFSIGIVSLAHTVLDKYNVYTKSFKCICIRWYIFRKAYHESIYSMYQGISISVFFPPNPANSIVKKVVE